MKRINFQLLCVVYGVLFIGYSLWTYFLTDPNLIITSWVPFVHFQEWMWSVDSKIVTFLYILLMVALFSVYFQMVSVFQKLQFKNFNIRDIFFINRSTSIVPVTIFTIILSMSVLLFSYNALSHDVFNYMFNAKMVVEYEANPHIQTALEFAPDDWLRFMHNVHTPAPYWYGWTALSVIPFIFGFGKFIITWLVFRLWSVLGLLILLFAQWSLAQKLKLEQSLYWLLLFALNPLVMIELISNSHNDAWMMWPAVLSISLLFFKQEWWRFEIFKKRYVSWIVIAFSFGLLLFSLSIKIATVLLIPFWMYLFLNKTKVGQELILKIESSSNVFKSLKLNFDTQLFDLMSIALFIPLLTERAQQFHPWYLVWSLSFLPFLTWKWWRDAILILSVSSLFRYVPWMWSGAYEYTSEIQLQQKLITWLPFVTFIIYYTLSLFFSRKQKYS